MSKTVILFVVAVLVILPVRADSEMDRARTLADQGHSVEAASAWERVIAHARQSGDRAALATSLLELADLRLSAGKYTDAIRFAEETGPLFNALHLTKERGRALTISGLAHYYEAEYPAALIDLNRALELARSIGDDDSAVVRLNNIGSVYYSEGRYADALASYQEAQKIVDAARPAAWVPGRRQLTIANTAILYQRLGEYTRALELYTRVRQSGSALSVRENAQLLANIGILYRRLGDPYKALQQYQQARDLYARSPFPSGAISVLNDIGIVQALDLHQPREAVQTFTRAIALADETGDRLGRLHSLLYRGEAEWRLEDIDSAESDFSTAADAAIALHTPEEQWKGLFGLARIRDRAGDQSACDRYLAQAIDTIESIRGGIDTSSRSDFLADKRDVYDLQVEREARKPHPNVSTLFRYIERAHGRSLQDRKAPSAQSIQLSSIGERLSQRAMLLDYWVGRTSLAVIWLTRSSSGVRYVACQDIADRVNRFLEAVRTPGVEDWRGAGAELTALLLSGVPIQSVQTLLVVPDGLLSQVPFEALSLPGSGSEPLLDSHVVSYSSTAYAIPSATRKRIRFPWQESAEIFASPQPQTASAKIDLAGSDTAVLSGAQTEGEYVRRAARGRCVVHAGAGALKKYLPSAADSAPPIIHFATHAVANLRDADRSYILMASADPDRRYDYLFLKEVSALKLDGTDLVVVSACDSGRGKLVPGEGIQSFSRAFLLAGARSVISSLWTVGDQSTSELMRILYENLSAGQSKAEALRNAKLQLRRSNRLAHPAYWAAFVLTGDGDSPIPYVIPPSFLGVVVVVIAAAIAGLWRVRRRRHVNANAAHV